MKIAVVLFCLFAYALAAPTEHEAAPASLLKHEEIHDEHGYSVEFELDDGTLVKENAKKAEGPEGEVFFRRTGTYKYLSPEGELIEVHYNADENGFRAEGDHLPKVVA